jgi:hypothetical protein
VPDVVRVFLDEGSTWDVHVLRGGAASPALDSAVWLVNDAGTVDRPANIATLAPGWTFQIQASFFGAPTAQGITVAANGSVTAVGAPGTRPLQNFLIRAVATPPGGATAQHPSRETAVRVHVHSDVVRVWLTPQHLTVPAGATNFSFTVLAEFDDGVVGDITDWATLSWSAAPAGPVTFGARSKITSGPAPAAYNVTMSVPSGTGPKTDTGLLTVGESCRRLGQLAQLDFLGGKGPGFAAQVPNVLLLCDGFTTKDDFDRYAAFVVERLRTNDYWRPYKDLADSINYWKCFRAANGSGASILAEAYSTGGSSAANLDTPQLPDPNAPAAQAWTLPELLYMVGQPVPHDTTVPLATKLGDWQTLFGPAITQAKVESAYEQWQACIPRFLANEVDNAFGMSTGERPRVQYTAIPRIVGLNDKCRWTSADVDEFLRGLSAAGSPTFGARWATGGADFGRVAFIVNAPLYGGGNADQHLAFSLCESRVFEVAAVPPRGFDAVQLSVPSKPKALSVHVLAHELAHSPTWGHLGDEYGGDALAYDGARDVDVHGNLELETNLRSAPGAPLSGDLIKWQWPRISKVALIDGQPAGSAPWTLMVKAGYGGIIGFGDRVRLRPHPLRVEVKPLISAGNAAAIKSRPGGQSDPLIVTAATPTHITVQLEAGGSFNPSDFPGPANLLFVPTRSSETDRELPIMHELILQHINTTHGPLNAPHDQATRPAPMDASGNDPQFPENLPDALSPGLIDHVCPRRPFERTIGLYEQGETYQAGVYHCAGECAMRRGGDGGTERFCHVCRYLIVDMIDPSKHGQIDAAYATEYPRP